MVTKRYVNIILLLLFNINDPINYNIYEFQRIYPRLENTINKIKQKISNKNTYNRFFNVKLI